MDNLLWCKYISSGMYFDDFHLKKDRAGNLEKSEKGIAKIQRLEISGEGPGSNNCPFLSIAHSYL